METSNAARYLMIGIICTITCFAAMANLGNIIRLAFRKKVSRFSLIAWGILGLIIAFCAFDTFKIEPFWVKVENNTIQTSRMAAGSKFRIVQLSDLHLEGIGKRERQMLHLTTAQQPDIIVLTGDYLNSMDDARGAALLKEIGERLCAIAPTYAVEGNWDSEAHLAELASGGVKILDNRWTEVKSRSGARIALGGYNWTHKKPWPRCPRSMGADYKVVLCHMCYLDDAPENSMDLVLTGHTHGGQIRVPVFGALLPDQCLVGKFQKGLYQYKQGKLYVNSGIGMEGGAPQVRFCCRPIVAVFDIVGKKE